MAVSVFLRPASFVLGLAVVLALTCPQKVEGGGSLVTITHLVITNAKQRYLPTSGSQYILISGGGWGKSPVAAIGATDCTKTRWVSPTKLKCKAPHGVGHSLPISVKDKGKRFVLKNAISYAPPVIAHSAPKSGSKQGGRLAHIFGYQFGDKDPKHPPVVHVGQTLCAEVEWVSTIQIDCVTPPATNDGKVSISVTIGAQTAVKQNAYSYQEPPHYASIVVHQNPMPILRRLCLTMGRLGRESEQPLSFVHSNIDAMINTATTRAALAAKKLKQQEIDAIMMAHALVLDRMDNGCQSVVRKTGEVAALVKSAEEEAEIEGEEEDGREAETGPAEAEEHDWTSPLFDHRLHNLKRHHIHTDGPKFWEHLFGSEEGGWQGVAFFVLLVGAIFAVVYACLSPSVRRSVRSKYLGQHGEGVYVSLDDALLLVGDGMDNGGNADNNDKELISSRRWHSHGMHAPPPGEWMEVTVNSHGYMQPRSRSYVPFTYRGLDRDGHNIINDGSYTDRSSVRRGPPSDCSSQDIPLRMSPFVPLVPNHFIQASTPDASGSASHVTESSPVLEKVTPGFAPLTKTPRSDESDSLVQTWSIANNTLSTALSSVSNSAVFDGHVLQVGPKTPVPNATPTTNIAYEQQGTRPPLFNQQPLPTTTRPMSSETSRSPAKLMSLSSTVSSPLNARPPTGASTGGVASSIKVNRAKHYSYGSTATSCDNSQRSSGSARPAFKPGGR